MDHPKEPDLQNANLELEETERKYHDIIQESAKSIESSEKQLEELESKIITENR